MHSDAIAQTTFCEREDFRPTDAAGYTSRMDAVRFGRALGFGARQAVKTVATAVDAATTENPRAKGDRARTCEAKTVGTIQQTALQQTGRRPAKQRARGVGRGLRGFVEATWKPWVRLGGVLWLEFTGVFFGLFAAFALSGVWKWRTAWRLSASNAQDHGRWMGSVAMAVVFVYFCVSSFARARRRERRR